MEILVVRGGEMTNVDSRLSKAEDFIRSIEQFEVPMRSFISDMYVSENDEILSEIREYFTYNDRIFVLEYESLVQLTDIYSDVHYPDNFPISFIELLDEISDHRAEGVDLRMTLYILH